MNEYTWKCTRNPLLTSIYTYLCDELRHLCFRDPSQVPLSVFESKSKLSIWMTSHSAVSQFPKSLQSWVRFHWTFAKSQLPQIKGCMARSLACSIFQPLQTFLLFLHILKSMQVKKLVTQALVTLGCHLHVYLWNGPKFSHHCPCLFTLTTNFVDKLQKFLRFTCTYCTVHFEQSLIFLRDSWVGEHVKFTSRRHARMLSLWLALDYPWEKRGTACSLHCGHWCQTVALQL